MIHPSFRTPFVFFALFFAVGLPATVQADSTEWALFAPDCSRGTSALEFVCGSRGVYHLVDVVAPAGCTPLAEGNEDPPNYSGGPQAAPFPVPPTILEETTIVRSIDSRGGDDPELRAMTGGGVGGSSSGGADPTRWVAVVDYDTAHGWSTTYISDLLAGPGIDAYLVELNDPALDMIGPEINDFHVLNALCKILKQVDGDAVKLPVGVNMSFGRFLSASETGLGPGCNNGTVACEIAEVLGEFRSRGTTIGTAAGNYGELLFPAGLAQALPIGMQDVNTLFTAPSSSATSLWETPAEASALAPGGHLCVEGWPLPSGSSYSSAILSGWLAKLKVVYDLDPHAAAAWYPVWNPDLACWVLHDGQTSYPGCNPAFDALLAGLEGESENVCWAASLQPVVSTTNPAVTTGPPGVPSFDAWASGTHPTPEGDPCVPCVGFVESGGADLEIDMSQSEPLDPGLYIDEVLLRVGTSFYPLTLDPTELALIEDGNLAILRLEGWAWTLPTTSQPSLYFVMKSSPSTSCSSNPDCFFLSTPVYVKQPGF